MSKSCKCKKGGSKAAKTGDAITASGFLTNEQLGPKQSFTAEGFLLCEAVPIARIGTQLYAAIELPDLEDRDGIIEVDRDEDVVFSLETIASFKGKPVTIDHPDDPVTPLNWKELSKGTLHNVRRGEGEQADLLVADLLITDAELIDLIVRKVIKEVSCGYDAEYEQIAPGRARQTSIVGNHLAFVKSARCGPVCSVQDSGNFIGETPMAAKQKKPSFAERMRNYFNTNDSEAFEKALDELPEGVSPDDKDTHVHIHMPGATSAAPVTADDDEPPAAKQADPVLAALAEISTAIKVLGDRVTALEGAKTGDNGDVVNPKGKTGDGDEEVDPPEAVVTGDSSTLVAEFQDAKSRAEILAPGIKFPTLDSKADKKKSIDALCGFRRRALTVALAGDNEDLVKLVTGDADVAKLTCDSAKAMFNAASELVKHKNSSVQAQQHHQSNAAAKSSFESINERNAEFWKRKA